MWMIAKAWPSVPALSWVSKAAAGGWPRGAGTGACGWVHSLCRLSISESIRWSATTSV